MTMKLQQVWKPLSPLTIKHDNYLTVAQIHKLYICDEIKSKKIERILNYVRKQCLDSLLIE